MKRKISVIVLAISYGTISFVQAQRVGINGDGSVPAASAALDIKSTTSGFLLPRLTSVQRGLIFQPANGLMVYDNDADHIYNFNTQSGWRKLLTTDYWQGLDNITYTISDSVGIGTSNPVEKLHISQGNLKISNGDFSIKHTTGLSQKIEFDFTGNSPNGYIHGLDFFVSGGPRKGYINYTHSNTSGESALILSPAGANIVSLKSGGNFIFNATSAPTIQLQSAGISTGFIQVDGNNIRMGTNLGNSTGKFVVRTNGADQLFVTNLGRVGIGQSSPAEMLDINGNMYALGTIKVNTKLIAANIEISGAVTKPSISTAALTPLCYGSIYADGTIRSATPNVTVSRFYAGFYSITCSGIDANCVILVTAADERHLCNGSYDTFNNTATVTIFRDNSSSPPSASSSDFCFVIYKK